MRYAKRGLLRICQILLVGLMLFLIVVILTRPNVWFPVDVAWEGIESLSNGLFSDGHAGADGFVKVNKQGHFCFGDNPGKERRFWGLQLVGFPTPAVPAEILAGRLHSYGFNLWKGGIQGYLVGKRFSSEAWDKLDRFVYEMKKAGLYWYLQVGEHGMVRALSSGMEPLWHDESNSGLFTKGFKRKHGPHNPAMLVCYLMEPHIFDAAKEYWRKTFSHVNAYTNNAYKDEPAILCVELSNENYLLSAWEAGILKLNVFPEYYERYFQRLWNEWIIESIRQKWRSAGQSLKAERWIRGEPDRSNNSGGLRLELKKRWDDGTGKGLLDDEDPLCGTVRRYPERPQKDKGNSFSQRRTLDLLAFYEHLQRKYFEESKRYLRSIGVKVPIIASNWSQMSLPGLRSVSGMDIMDTHLYFDLPRPENFKGKYRNHNTFNVYGLRNIESVLASNAIEHKPFCVSEINWMYPNQYQSLFLPKLSAYACLQDWDIVILYAHVSSKGKGDEGIRQWNLIENNPLIMTQSFISSLVFRNRLVKKAQFEVVFSYSKDFERASYLNSLTGHWVFTANPYPVSIGSRGERVRYEIALKHKVRKEFAINGFGGSRIEGSGNSRIEELSNSVSLKENTEKRVIIKGQGATKTWPSFIHDVKQLGEATAIASDTGEITYDREKERLVVNAEKYESVSGRLQGRIDALDGCEIEIEKPVFGSISLISLDDKAIGDSNRLLLSAVAKVRNSGMEWDQDRHRVLRWGKGPVLCERVEGKVGLKVTRADGRFRVWGLDGSGKEKSEIRPKLVDGSLAIALGNGDVVWYLIENEAN